MSKIEEMLEKANVAKSNAYAPYSKFYVGAAILSENNNIYTSCNVENVSFPCGTCAEAGAIALMISSGDKVIKEILVTSSGKELVYPCGACLQRIREFATTSTKIHLADDKKIIKTYLLKDLLPQQFSPKEF
ncbi:MAG: cytidine deaminase [Alphaproteobacteria bacterium]|nr:cytidine deaminase [Alphaproteobacteria bacterium]